MAVCLSQSPLVTQLYFSGDPWVEKDSSSASPAAKKRILEVQNLTGGSKKVEYNISMAKKLAIEPAAMGLLVGNYIAENDPNNKMELFRKDQQLWIKGDKTNGMPFGLNFEFVGDNTFTFPGTTVEVYSAVFEIGDYGKITMRETYTNDKGEKIVVVYKRVMK